MRQTAVVAILLACTASAGPPASPRPEILAEAREHHERGKTHYDLGELDEAIAEFKKAYALSGAPAEIFNIAQAYRLKKDYEQALLAYRTYLRLMPDAANQAEVERRLAEMERHLGEEKLAPDASEPPAPSQVPPPLAPSVATPPTVPIATATAEPANPRRSISTPGIVVGGAGAALLAASVYFGVRASQAAGELTRLSQSGGTWDARYDARWADGERSGKLAIWAGALGGAALVSGAILLYRF